MGLLRAIRLLLAERGDIVFRHACNLGFEGIVSKRLGSPYISGRSQHWIKSKNPAAPAVKREAEEDLAQTMAMIEAELRLRLGGDPADDEYPDKPPRMRWATYSRYAIR